MPPGDPRPDPVDWELAEREIGHRLPADYRELVDRYGIGSIDGRITICPPVWGEHASGIASIGQMTPSPDATGWLEHTRSRYSFWPAPGSLLCGLRLVDGNRDLWGAVYWHVTGDDPDQWPVVLWERYHPFEEIDSTMVGLLVEWLTESPDLPIGERLIFGAPHTRFIRWRTEQELREQGADPWEYLEPLYLEATEAEEQRDGLWLTEDGPTLLSDAVVGPDLPAVPQLMILGVESTADDELVVSASVALATDVVPSMPLEQPLGPDGPAVEVISGEGLLAVAFGAEVAVPVAGASLTVAADEPLVFDVRLPQAAIIVDSTWTELVSRVASGRAALKLIVRDPAVAAVRAAAGEGGSESDVMIAWWPPKS
jgi:hypothetical protein